MPEPTASLRRLRTPLATHAANLIEQARELLIEARLSATSDFEQEINSWLERSHQERV